MSYLFSSSFLFPSNYESKLFKFLPLQEFKAVIQFNIYTMNIYTIYLIYIYTMPLHLINVYQTTFQLLRMLAIVEVIK